jgi:signal transduction histidine kinase
MDQLSYLFKDEARWGEKKAMLFRWLLAGVVIVLITYIYITGHPREALFSLGPALSYVVYNLLLAHWLKKDYLGTWVRYLSTTVDISILSLHIYIYSILFNPIGVATAASAFIYPILILLAVLRYDRNLIIYATLYAIFCYNIIYYIRLPFIEQELIDNVLSSDPAGHFYKSVYLGVFGFFLLNIPDMIDRLVLKQKRVLDDVSKTELNLALETQKNKLANQKLDLEKDLNKQLQEQKEQITQQNEALQNLNATKDKLLSVIGHDLKNPFAVQASLARLLKSELATLSTDDIQQSLSVIIRSAESGTDLLANLLDWARSQNKTLKFHPAPLTIELLIEESINLQANQIHHKDLQILTRIQTTNAAYADANSVRTVIRNLLSNAIKFTPKQGTITITTSQLNGMIQIAIEDTGIGIAEEQLNTLFDPKTKTNSKGTENEPGTGLGLLLCKEFVEKNGGAITVNSTMNKGTTFSFTLPTSPEHG